MGTLKRFDLGMGCVMHLKIACLYERFFTFVTFKMFNSSVHLLMFNQSRFGLEQLFTNMTIRKNHEGSGFDAGLLMIVVCDDWKLKVEIKSTVLVSTEGQPILTFCGYLVMELIH